MMMIITIIKKRGIWPLSSLAFPAHEKMSNTLLFHSHERDKSCAIFWSSPLNLGATKIPKEQS